MVLSRCPLTFVQDARGGPSLEAMFVLCLLGLHMPTFLPVGEGPRPGEVTQSLLGKSFDGSLSPPSVQITAKHQRFPCFLPACLIPPQRVAQKRRMHSNLVQTVHVSPTTVLSFCPSLCLSFFGCLFIFKIYYAFTFPFASFFFVFFCTRLSLALSLSLSLSLAHLAPQLLVTLHAAVTYATLPNELFDAHVEC